MPRILIIVISLLPLFCNAENDWNEEYFEKSPIKFLKLNCSNEKAIEISLAAVEEKQPSHYSRVVEKGFSVFSTPYGNRFGSMQSYGTLKSILGYKAIEHKRYGGSYYEESIEVSLSKSCEVLDVVYFKSKVEYLDD